MNFLWQYVAKKLAPHTQVLANETIVSCRQALEEALILVARGEALAEKQERRIDSATQAVVDGTKAFLALQDNVYLLQDHLHAFGDFFGVDFVKTDGDIFCGPKPEKVEEAHQTVREQSLLRVEEQTIRTLFLTHRRLTELKANEQRDSMLYGRRKQ